MDNPPYWSPLQVLNLIIGVACVRREVSAEEGIKSSLRDFEEVIEEVLTKMRNFETKKIYLDNTFILPFDSHCKNDTYNNDKDN